MLKFLNKSKYEIERLNGIIDNFIVHCNDTKNELVIQYQDEHLKSILGMITTLQIIEHIIKKANCNFNLEFLIEKYQETTYRSGITYNLYSDSERDKTLQSLTEEWLYNLKMKGFDGKIIEINSKERRSLSHWRVLSISCGGKRLSIYPDGGFINGWIIARNGNIRYYQPEDTTTEDDILIARVEDIKFDVCLEDNYD